MKLTKYLYNNSMEIDNDSFDHISVLLTSLGYQ